MTDTRRPLRIDVITIFPEYLDALRLALVGKAVERGLLTIAVHDLRDWTHDVHRTVDDSPYGGGAGMVMRPEPWWEALGDVTAGADQPRIVVPTPSGRRFDHRYATELATASHLIFCAGRYEGIDQRVIDHWATDELSLGDYVVNGGEVAVLAVVEAVARLLPGMVGNAASVVDDSFATGLLEGPVYTRPEIYGGLAVPAVLRSGDHAAIAAWRREQALTRTRQRRPDLLPPAG
ncbi:MAG TPA: tRNA (guanosine(37)-N1)-methyltransferase TrmD [Mycobacteriales bacterium]|nr:tRNA (guanosine(37)-N1)-methyltransferase TrmD [Mycobacteriales bacterium]